MSRIDDLARSLAERPSPADVSRVRAAVEGPRARPSRPGAGCPVVTATRLPTGRRGRRDVALHAAIPRTRPGGRRPVSHLRRSSRHHAVLPAPGRRACKGGRRPVLRPQDRGVLLWARPVRRPADGLDLLGREPRARAPVRVPETAVRRHLLPGGRGLPRGGPVFARLGHLRRNARPVSTTVQVRNRGSVHKQASAVPHFKTAAGTAVAAGTAARRVARRGAATTPISAVTSPASAVAPQSQRCGSLCCEAGAVCCRASVAGELAGRHVGVGHYTCCSPGLEKESARRTRKAPAPRAVAVVGRGCERIRPSDAAAQGASRRLGRRRGRARRSRGCQEPGCAGGRSPALGPARFPLSAPGQGRQARARAVAPGPGLDAAGAQALNKLLAAEARAWSLLNAAATAYARSLGAIRASNVRAARSQARCVGQFAGKAAGLRSVPGLRAAAAAALQTAARRRSPSRLARSPTSRPRCAEAAYPSTCARA